MLQRSRYQDFVNDFTEEVILVLVAALRQKEREKEEKERIEKVVEVEKFKTKIFPAKTIQQPPQIRQFQKPFVGTFQNQMMPSIQPKQNIQQIPIISQQITTQKQEIKPVEIKTEQKTFLETKKKAETNITKIDISQNKPILQPGELDLGKIIYLIRDPLITYIECSGEKQNVTIKKAGQTLKTSVILTKEEIMYIIKVFSEATRIPLADGLLNARYENLEISAVASEIISPSFIIKKDIIPSFQRPNQYLMKQ